MSGEILGKISGVHFGMIPDHPYLFGLDLTFKLSDGCGIGTGGKYTVNISPSCDWTHPEDREKAITKTIDFVVNTMVDAKVTDIMALKGKPVLVTIENSTFKDFRILTEVL